MGIKLRTIPRFHVDDENGVPLSGGKVYTYQPGTSTPKATYTDFTGGTENDNPVILNSRGEATIYWDGVYKVIVTDSNDVTIWTEDNYGEGEDSVLTGNFNLVKNGSFEIDANGDGIPDDWTVVEYTGGTVERDSTEQRHGQYSLKFLSLGTGGGYATSDYFEVQQSLQYAVNFALYCSVADIHNVVDVVWYTAAKSVISTTSVYDDAAANPTSWTYYSYSATAPSNARFARVRITGAKDDDATVGTAWFDNVGLLEAGNASGQIPVNNGTVNVNLNADKVDGYNASESPSPSTVAARDSSGRLLAIGSGTNAQNVIVRGDNSISLVATTARMLWPRGTGSMALVRYQAGLTSLSSSAVVDVSGEMSTVYGAFVTEKGSSAAHMWSVSWSGTDVTVTRDSTGAAAEVYVLVMGA